MTRTFKVTKVNAVHLTTIDWDAYIARFPQQQPKTDHIIEVRYVQDGKLIRKRTVNMNVKFPLKNWEV